MSDFTVPTKFEIARGGYVRVPRPMECVDRRTKYPWIQLREGDHITTPFPWKKLNAVRMSIRKWNTDHKTAISVDPFPEGSAEHPFPHFIVGWVTGQKFNPKKPRRTIPEGLPSEISASKRPVADTSPEESAATKAE